MNRLFLAGSFVFFYAVSQAQTLHISAAASLREPLTAIAAAFQRTHSGLKVELAFAGSQQLAAQINQGAPCDVFASADERTMARVRLSGPPLVFARNRLVLIYPASTKRRTLQSLEQINSLIMAASPVPAGAYTRLMLASASKLYGLRWMRTVLSHVVSEEQDVRSVLAKVELGEADAGIVYVTDARSAGSKVRSSPIPARFQPRILYPVGVPLGADDKKRARDFIQFLLSRYAQAKLRGAGFMADSAGM